MEEERNGAGDVISGCAIVGGGQHRKHTCHPFFLSSKTMATFILSSPPPSTSAAPDDAEEQQQSCWLYICTAKLAAKREETGPFTDDRNSKVKSRPGRISTNKLWLLQL